MTLLWSRPRRALLWSVLTTVGLLALTVGYVAYQAWQVQGDLRSADSAARALQGAIRDQDDARMEAASDALAAAARAAHSRTDGFAWRTLGYAPVLGDDADGVRLLSASLDTVAGEGVPPLVAALAAFDDLTVDGRVNLDLVGTLAPSVAEAHRAFTTGNRRVESVDSAGFVGSLGTRFDEYRRYLGQTERGLASAVRATEVLPGLVGAEGERDYLLVFQNNAEIRAAGGLPGAWARVHAEDGLLTMEEQGTGGQFGPRRSPVLPLSPGERDLYGRLLGTDFRDATFTPDFPRAARLMAARWEEEVGTVDLDGVISLDVVALGYLLDGIGPVAAPGLTLTTDNLVETVLSTAYRLLAPEDQDAYFADVARVVFEAATGELSSDTRLIQAFDRAAAEGRFRIASFVERERTLLSGSRVEGRLEGDTGEVPHVDLDLNDATGSKMSYYLRSAASLAATGCEDGVQTLAGTLELRQVLDKSEASRLPDYVTGGGAFGTDPGAQLVVVRLHGPFGGTLTNLRVAGENVDDVAQVVQLDGRPAAALVAYVTGRAPVRLEWVVTTGSGQVADPVLRVTPGVAATPVEAAASLC